MSRLGPQSATQTPAASPPPPACCPSRKPPIAAAPLEGGASTPPSHLEATGAASSPTSSTRAGSPPRGLQRARSPGRKIQWQSSRPVWWLFIANRKLIQKMSACHSLGLTPSRNCTFLQRSQRSSPSSRVQGPGSAGCGPCSGALRADSALPGGVQEAQRRPAEGPVHTAPGEVRLGRGPAGEMRGEAPCLAAPPLPLVPHWRQTDPGQ